MPKKTKIQRRKPAWPERIAAFCEVPPEVVSSIPVLVWRGHHEIEITGCTGVLEYDEQTVVLALGAERLAVRGRALVLTDFRENVLYVRGTIVAAVYESGAGVC